MSKLYRGSEIMTEVQSKLKCCYSAILLILFFSIQVGKWYAGGKFILLLHLLAVVHCLMCFGWECFKE